MTVHAVASLFAFNVLLAAVGTPVLLAMQPALTAKDLLRFSGVSYLLGVASLMVVFTLLIVVGVPLTLGTIVATGVLVAAASGAIAQRRRVGRSSVQRQLRSPGLLWVPSAVLLAAIAVLLEAIFRKGRLQGLLEFDGWDSWGPKVKALYDFGHLSPSFLATLPGGSYPPGLPAILSAGLHAIGSPDMVTLHLQYWFFGVGFIGALLGLLTQRVSALVLLPFVLLVFVMPDIRSRSVDFYGDLPMGFLIAVAALLVAVWLDDREGWELLAAGVLLAGAVVTKREGLLLVACVVLAGLVASVDWWRQAWPRLGGLFLGVVIVWLPWQIWLRANSLPGNGPTGGLHFLTDGRRGWQSLHVVTSNIFTFDLWLVSATIAVAAVGLCVLARAWRMAAYLGCLFLVLVLGCAAILWSEPDLLLSDVNVVSRLVGTIALSLTAVTPLALQRVWDAGSTRSERAPARPSSWSVRLLSVAIAVGAAIAYPSVLLARGGARFPKVSDCVVAAAPGAAPAVVFGHVSSYPDALALEALLRDAGVRSLQLAQEGCGRVRVFVDARSAAAGQAIVHRVQTAGLAAHLEAQTST